METEQKVSNLIIRNTYPEYDRQPIVKENAKNFIELRKKFQEKKDANDSWDAHLNNDFPYVITRLEKMGVIYNEQIAQLAYYDEFARIFGPSAEAKGLEKYARIAANDLTGITGKLTPNAFWAKTGLKQIASLDDLTQFAMEKFGKITPLEYAILLNRTSLLDELGGRLNSAFEIEVHFLTKKPKEKDGYGFSNQDWRNFCGLDLTHISNEKLQILEKIRQKKTPITLLDAIELGDYRLCDYLLQNNCEINDLQQKDKLKEDGKSELYTALTKKEVVIARLLLRKYLLDKKQYAIKIVLPINKIKTEMTLLELVAFLGFTHELEAILNWKDVNLKKHPNIILFALAGSQFKLVKRILKENDIDPILLNQKDKEGNTPLKYAILSGDSELVKLLIEAEANKEEPGLFEFARANKQFEMMDVLLRSGIDVKKINATELKQQHPQYSEVIFLLQKIHNKKTLTEKIIEAQKYFAIEENDIFYMASPDSTEDLKLIKMLINARVNLFNSFPEKPQEKHWKFYLFVCRYLVRGAIEDDFLSLNFNLNYRIFLADIQSEGFSYYCLNRNKKSIEDKENIFFPDVMYTALKRAISEQNGEKVNLLLKNIELFSFGNEEIAYAINERAFILNHQSLLFQAIISRINHSILEKMKELGFVLSDEEKGNVPVSHEPNEKKAPEEKKETVKIDVDLVKTYYQHEINEKTKIPVHPPISSSTEKTEKTNNKENLKEEKEETQTPVPPSAPTISLEGIKPILTGIAKEAFTTAEKDKDEHFAYFKKSTFGKLPKSEHFNTIQKVYEKQKEELETYLLEEIYSLFKDILLASIEKMEEALKEASLTLSELNTIKQQCLCEESRIKKLLKEKKLSKGIKESANSILSRIKKIEENIILKSDNRLVELKEHADQITHKYLEGQKNSFSLELLWKSQAAQQLFKEIPSEKEKEFSEMIKNARWEYIRARAKTFIEKKDLEELKPYCLALETLIKQEEVPGEIKTIAEKIKALIESIEFTGKLLTSIHNIEEKLKKGLLTSSELNEIKKQCLEENLKAKEFLKQKELPEEIKEKITSALDRVEKIKNSVTDKLLDELKKRAREMAKKHLENQQGSFTLNGFWQSAEAQELLKYVPQGKKTEIFKEVEDEKFAYILAKAQELQKGKNFQSLEKYRAAFKSLINQERIPEDIKKQAKEIEILFQTVLKEIEERKRADESLSLLKKVENFLFELSDSNKKLSPEKFDSIRKERAQFKAQLTKNGLPKEIKAEIEKIDPLFEKVVKSHTKQTVFKILKEKDTFVSTNDLFYSRELEKAKITGFFSFSDIKDIKKEFYFGTIRDFKNKLTNSNANLSEIILSIQKSIPVWEALYREYDYPEEVKKEIKEIQLLLAELLKTKTKQLMKGFITKNRNGCASLEGVFNYQPFREFYAEVLPVLEENGSPVLEVVDEELNLVRQQFFKEFLLLLDKKEINVIDISSEIADFLRFKSIRGESENQINEVEEKLQNLLKQEKSPIETLKTLAKKITKVYFQSQEDFSETAIFEFFHNMLKGFSSEDSQEIFNIIFEEQTFIFLVLAEQFLGNFEKLINDEQKLSNEKFEEWLDKIIYYKERLEKISEDEVYSQTAKRLLGKIEDIEKSLIQNNKLLEILKKRAITLAENFLSENNSFYVSFNYLIESNEAYWEYIKKLTYETGKEVEKTISDRLFNFYHKKAQQLIEKLGKATVVELTEEDQKELSILECFFKDEMYSKNSDLVESKKQIDTLLLQMKHRALEAEALGCFKCIEQIENNLLENSGSLIDLKVEYESKRDMIEIIYAERSNKEHPYKAKFKEIEQLFLEKENSKKENDAILKIKNAVLNDKELAQEHLWIVFLTTIRTIAERYKSSSRVQEAAKQVLEDAFAKLKGAKLEASLSKSVIKLAEEFLLAKEVLEKKQEVKSLLESAAQTQEIDEQSITSCLMQYSMWCRKESTVAEHIQKAQKVKELYVEANKLFDQTIDNRNKLETVEEKSEKKVKEEMKKIEPLFAEEEMQLLFSRVKPS